MLTSMEMYPGQGDVSQFLFISLETLLQHVCDPRAKEMIRGQIRFSYFCLYSRAFNQFF